MAKSKIGNLFVTLGLSSKKFVKGLNRSTRNVSMFKRGITKAIPAVAALGSATAGVAVAGIGALVAAGTAAVGIMAALTKSSFKTSDELAKVGDKLGIATEKLAGLRHAAELADVGVSTIDTGLQRMVRRISEAADGTGEARAAIAELGLDAKKLERLTVDKQFQSIADSFKNIHNQSDRVRLSFKLFDSEGVGILNILKGGSEGLQKIQGDALKFGLAINRVDARKIEQANDAFTRISAVLKGAGNTLAQRVAPFAGAFADSLTNMGTSGRGLKGVFSDMFDVFLRGVGFSLDAFDHIEVAFRRIRLAGANAFRALNLVATAFVEKAIGAVNLIWPEFGKGAIEALRNLDDGFEHSIKQFGEDLDKSVANIGSRRQRFEGFVQDVQLRAQARAQLPVNEALAAATSGGAGATALGANNATMLEVMRQVADGVTQTANNTREGMGVV